MLSPVGPLIYALHLITFVILYYPGHRLTFTDFCKLQYGFFFWGVVWGGTTRFIFRDGLLKSGIVDWTMRIDGLDTRDQPGRRLEVRVYRLTNHR